MRIGILTQALHGNYGGLLQNYALQKVLENMGHSVITIDRHKFIPENVIKKIGKRLFQILKPQYGAEMLTHSQRIKLSDNQLNFKSTYINATSPLYTQESFDKIVQNSDFEAFIVGSDQCWRPCYSVNITNYFLDFSKDKDVKRVAYAASFGVDTWEYSQEQTNLVIESAKNMDAISVREESGKTLCQSYLNLPAEWVLDPTMLLGVDGFRQFVKQEFESSPFITDYLLEPSDKTDSLVEHIKLKYGVNHCRHNNGKKTYGRFTSLSKHKNISVEDWISNIANAQFVITDSFHGAVFSILFNIPFVVVLNGIRGNARIESLLKDFNLEYCIYHGDDYNIPSIDWNQVNDHLKRRQMESRSFLLNALR